MTCSRSADSCASATRACGRHRHVDRHTSAVRSDEHALSIDALARALDALAAAAGELNIAAILAAAYRTCL